MTKEEIEKWFKEMKISEYKSRTENCYKYNDIAIENKQNISIKIVHNTSDLNKEGN